MDQNEKKSSQLGMPNGTASGRLRKMVLFDVLKRHSENVCFKCGEPIESPDELSIEHKIPWLDSDDPYKMFFDLDNIAFSHLSCNISDRRVRMKDRRKGTSGFFGVSHDTTGNRKKRWRVEVFDKGERIQVGRYSTAEEAAAEYDKYVSNLYPDAVTNKSSGLI